MRKESKVELVFGMVIVSAIAVGLVAPRFFAGDDSEPVVQGQTEESAAQKAAARLSVEKGEYALADTEVARSEPEAPAREAAPPSPQAPPSPEAPEASAPAGDWADLFEKGRKLVDEDDLFEARPVLTQALMAAPEGAQREGVRALLDRINQRLIFSPLPTPDSTIHVVQPGESLWVLSQKYNTPTGLIKLANNKSRDTIRVGERLKVLVGEWTGVVELSQFRLTIFFNGDYAAEFPVGIGMDEKTPIGTFVIDSKEEDPTWYAPQGGVFPPDHEENILGTRWLGFKETAEYSGYGIHGTTLPESIGKAESAGCVRLRNEDVEMVYFLLRRGDKVTIKP